MKAGGFLNRHKDFGGKYCLRLQSGRYGKNVSLTYGNHEHHKNFKSPQCLITLMLFCVPFLSLLVSFCPRTIIFLTFPTSALFLLPLFLCWFFIFYMTIYIYLQVTFVFPFSSLCSFVSHFFTHSFHPVIPSFSR